MHLLPASPVYAYAPAVSMQSIIDEEDKDELFNVIADQIHDPPGCG